MPTPSRPRSKRPVRPTVRRRHRYRRVLALLLTVFATELMWRTGAFAHTAAHVHASPVAAAHRAHHLRRSRPRPAVPVVASPSPSPLESPSPATTEQRQTELDRLISLGYPVCRGAGTKPLVALTFDDGPGPYTQQTVDLLKRDGVRATFFIVAKELIGWPQLADEPAVEAGVGAIGDHTYDHIGLVGLTPANLQHEIGDAKTLIERHDGGVPVQLFRPPYGRHDAAVDAEVHALGMLEVLWTVDSGDGLRGSTASSVLQTIENHIGPGAIVLMHENRATTQNMLPQLLDFIRSKGLQTVTVPELLAEDPPSIAQLKSESCG